MDDLIDQSDIFSREFRVYNEARDFLEKNTNTLRTSEVEQELFQRYTKLLDEYLRLYKNMVRLTRISDSNQKNLIEATEKIRQQQEELQKKNQSFEDDLSLAMVIQNQLIPEHSPDKRITSFYKPMQKIGGDLIDFFELPGSNRVGVFISDVSGHGVPAALITAMLKSFLLKGSAHWGKPSELLYYLHESLQNMVYNHFVTALYGIIDFNKKEFLYANAGQCYPLLIGDDTIQNVDGGGIPLAMFRKHELEVDYRERSIDLSDWEKLFLYSDGLTEAVPEGTGSMSKGVEDFETAQFKRSLKNHADKDGMGFVNSIVRDLVQFRQSDEFDDDICIINVDLS